MYRNRSAWSLDRTKCLLLSNVATLQQRNIVFIYLSTVCDNYDINMPAKGKKKGKGRVSAEEQEKVVVSCAICLG